VPGKSPQAEAQGHNVDYFSDGERDLKSNCEDDESDNKRRDRLSPAAGGISAQHKVAQ
jgi:hypothetical protein